MSIIAGVLSLAVCIFPSAVSKADSVEVKPYIAFGADLNSSQKKTVMKQLEVTSEELADYEVIEVTNGDEQESVTPA